MDGELYAGRRGGSVNLGHAASAVSHTANCDVAMTTFEVLTGHNEIEFCAWDVRNMERLGHRRARVLDVEVQCEWRLSSEYDRNCIVTRVVSCTV